MMAASPSERSQRIGAQQQPHNRELTGVATINVQCISCKTGHVFKLLDRVQADVVCMQEAGVGRFSKAGLMDKARKQGYDSFVGEEVNAEGKIGMVMVCKPRARKLQIRGVDLCEERALAVLVERRGSPPVVICNCYGLANDDRSETTTL